MEGQDGFTYSIRLASKKDVNLTLFQDKKYHFRYQHPNVTKNRVIETKQPRVIEDIAALHSFYVKFENVRQGSWECSKNGHDDLDSQWTERREEF